MKYTPVNRGFDTFYGFFDALEDYYSHRVEYNVSDVLFSGLDSWNQTSEFLEPILNKNGTFSQVCEYCNQSQCSGTIHIIIYCV